MATELMTKLIRDGHANFVTKFEDVVDSPGLKIYQIYQQAGIVDKEELRDVLDNNEMAKVIFADGECGHYAKMDGFIYGTKGEVMTAEQSLQRQINDLMAYLQTLAKFGGTLDQARELAQKAVDKYTNKEN